MIIRDYSKNTLDGVQHIGRIVGRDYVSGGAIGYYEFATMQPVLYAWLFIPQDSRGEYQHVRSPENYLSLEAAAAAAQTAWHHLV